MSVFMGLIPPLIAIAEGRKVRARKEPVWCPKESKLHIDVANTLRDHCLPDWRWSHFPAGAPTNVITGSRLKRMGLRRGWADFLLISPTGLAHCLECKRMGEGLTDDQEGFQAWCMGHGVPFVTAYSIDDALTAFDEWGCLRIRI